MKETDLGKSLTHRHRKNKGRKQHSGRVCANISIIDIVLAQYIDRGGRNQK